MQQFPCKVAYPASNYDHNNLACNLQGTLVINLLQLQIELKTKIMFFVKESIFLQPMSF